MKLFFTEIFVLFVLCSIMSVIVRFIGDSFGLDRWVSGVIAGILAENIRRKNSDYFDRKRNEE